MIDLQHISDIFAREETRVVSVGTTLIRPDDRPAHAFFLVSGVVKMLSFSPDGTSVLVHLILPGSAFPLLSTSASASNRFWFQAMTEVTTKQVKYPLFVQTIQRNPAVLMEQYEKMISAVDGLAYRIESLISQDVHERLWSALEYLQKHFGVAVSPGVVRIDLHVTHQDLASFIGSSRETVSREWERLKAAGKVDLVEGKIIVYQATSYKLQATSINAIKL